MPRGDPSKLVPNSARTPQSVQENTTKGGVASGVARRKNKERRNIVQTILDGTYKDKSGKEVTGEELFIHGLITNLADPKSRNWHVAVKIIADATGMTMTDDAKRKLASEIDKIQADTELTKAKTRILAGDENKEASPVDLITEEIFKYQEAMKE